MQLSRVLLKANAKALFADGLWAQAAVLARAEMCRRGAQERRYNWMCSRWPASEVQFRPDQGWGMACLSNQAVQFANDKKI